MKSIKKIIALALCVSTLLTASFSAFAENEATELKIIGVEEILADKEAWVDKAEILSVTDKKLEREYSKNHRIFNYTGEKYLNEIFEFDLTLYDLKEGTSWNSIILRGSEKNGYGNLWTDNYQSYCFLIRTNSVEVQRYQKNQPIVLGAYPCEIKSDEKFTVRAGALNVEGGVQLLLYINGKQIFNIFDNNEEEGGYITESGYLGFYNSSKIAMEPASKKGDEIKGIPASFFVSEYTPKTTVLKADYEILGDTKVETAWYSCEEKPVWTLAAPEMKAPKEIVKIEGSENKNEYTLTDSDKNKYIVFGIIDEDGNLSFTESIHIDPLASALSKDIYMVVDNTLAYANGEKVNVDKNADVTPILIDTTAYVPLRFVVEKAGGEVSWNEGGRTVEIKVGDYVSSINIDCKCAKVDGGKIILNNAPVIKNDRTMLSVSDLYSLTGLHAKNFYDCVISVTKEEVDFSVSEVAQLETAIIK